MGVCISFNLPISGSYSSSAKRDCTLIPPVSILWIGQCLETANSLLRSWGVRSPVSTISVRDLFPVLLDPLTLLAVVCKDAVVLQAQFHLTQANAVMMGVGVQADSGARAQTRQQHPVGRQVDERRQPGGTGGRRDRRGTNARISVSNWLFWRTMTFSPTIDLLYNITMWYPASA